MSFAVAQMPTEEGKPASDRTAPSSAPRAGGTFAAGAEQTLTMRRTTVDRSAAQQSHLYRAQTLYVWHVIYTKRADFD